MAVMFMSSLRLSVSVLFLLPCFVFVLVFVFGSCRVWACDCGSSCVFSVTDSVSPPACVLLYVDDSVYVAALLTRTVGTEVGASHEEYVCIKLLLCVTWVGTMNMPVGNVGGG